MSRLHVTLTGLALVSSLLLASGCVDDRRALIDVTESFAVTFTNNQGPAGQPLPVSFNSVEIKLDIEARDNNNQLDTDFNGPVEIHCSRGQLSGDTNPILVDGKVTNVSVQVAKTFGKIRLVIEEPVSQIRGVSPEIVFHDPKISDIQKPVDQDGNSAFFGYPIQINTGFLVVTNVLNDGFYLSDTSDRPEYSHIFVYTYSFPDQYDDLGEVITLRKGHRLNYINGNVYEFTDSTQLSFPVWEVTDKNDTSNPMPEHKLLTDSVFNNDEEMEKYEAALVKVENVYVGYFECDNTNLEYMDYGQWPVRMPGGRVLSTITRTNVPEFDPCANMGKQIVVLKGNLKQVFSNWSILPSEPEDLVIAP